MLDPEGSGSAAGSDFPLLFLRFLSLHSWLDSGTRPSPSSPLHAVSDSDLFDADIPIKLETKLLSERISAVLSQLNESLCSIVASHGPKLGSGQFPLDARPSTIPGAGLGLFNSGELAIPAGSTVTHYYGALRTLRTANQCPDRRYHLLLPVPPRGWVLPAPCASASGLAPSSALRPSFPLILDCLDPASFSDLPARYVNDPRCARAVNVCFKPSAERPLAAAVEALRDIKPGEELFIDYGDAYWDSAGEEAVCIVRSEGAGGRKEEAKSGDKGANEDSDDDDDDSALFQSSFSADWGA